MSPKKDNKKAEGVWIANGLEFSLEIWTLLTKSPWKHFNTLKFEIWIICGLAKFQFLISTLWRLSIFFGLFVTKKDSKKALHEVFVSLQYKFAACTWKSNPPYSVFPSFPENILTSMSREQKWQTITQSTQPFLIFQ